MAVTTVQRGRLFGDRGQFEESIPYFDAAIAIFADLGARWELADATAERGISNRELGRLDEAEEDLRQAVRISEELGERQLAGWTWRALARVAEKRGDEVEAEAERGHAGRFGAGLPRINDGSFLFLQHMISKMSPVADKGSRLAIVFNGSPLFTGATTV